MALLYQNFTDKLVKARNLITQASNKPMTKKTGGYKIKDLK